MAHFVTAALSRIITVLIVVVFGLFSLPVMVSQTSRASVALPEFPTAQPAAVEPAGHTVNLVGYDAQGLTLLARGQSVPIAFVGSAAVWPELATGGNLRGEQVRYPELWKGIDLVLINISGGGVTALYQLAPFADPGRIQLSTPADFQIQTDGSLGVELAGSVVTVSTPHAWQEIGGQRVTVGAGHILSGAPGNRLAGLHLDAYDPLYPLLIEIDFGG